MIKINLLKRAAPPRGGRRIPMVLIVKTGVIALAVLAVVAGGAGIMRWWLKRPQRAVPAAVERQAPPEAQPAEHAAPLPAEPQETAQASAPAAPAPEEASPPAVREPGYTPSTLVKPKMVEDVVDEVDGKEPGKGAPDLVELAYREMSSGEKINYEFMFTRKVLQILTDAVPAGIGFNELSIDSFATVTALGAGSTREEVSRLFTALRREQFQLFDPPRSSIWKGGRQGFHFRFACAASFGMDPADPFRLTDHVEPRESLRAALRTFSKTASQEGLSIDGALSQIGIEKNGNYRRFVYRMTGSGTYRAFVRFVIQLNAARLPCAFSRVRLKAHRGTALAVTADVIFTFRE
jgi:hypothetical protein